MKGVGQRRDMMVRMDDWTDVANAIGVTLAAGVLISVALSACVYGGVRLGRLIPKFRGVGWKQDLRPFRWISPIVCGLVFVPGLLLMVAFSDMCATSDVTEILSPDRQHKIEVYNCDCGALSDFSLNVSLLRANERLPKHKPAKLLYRLYHRLPSDFDVKWTDDQHVLVRVPDMKDRAAVREEEGVEVRFAQYR